MTVKGAVLCASLAVFGLLAAGVVSEHTQHADLVIRAIVHGWESPALTVVMTFVSRWGAPRVDAIVALLASIAFVFKRSLKGAVLLVFALVGAGLLRYMIARAFDRPRPMPFFAPRPLSYSFPSGHAVFGICVYGVLAGLLSAVASRRIERIAVWVLASLWVAAIGLSRIYLGFHYPTDVLAGYAVGAAWISVLLLAARLLPFWPPESAARRVSIGQ